MARRSGWLGDRSTADLLVLIIAATICVAVLVALVGVLAIEYHSPSNDISKAVGNLNDIINTLIGLMAGYLAGRTEVSRVRRRRDEDDDEV